MGVGGGFVAMEPGGERIVACREAALSLELQLRGFRAPRRSDSVPCRTASAGVLGQRPSSFFVELPGAKPGLTCGVAARRLGLGTIYGKHDRKLFVQTVR